MRDLVYQPVQPIEPHEIEALISTPAQPVATLSGTERFLAGLTKIGDTVHRLLTPQPNTSILQVARRGEDIPQSQSISLGNSTHTKKKAEVRKITLPSVNVSEKAALVGHHSKRVLASPSARTHLFQFALILTLFSYLSYQQRHLPVTTVSTVATPSTLRQYLPTTGTVKQSQPFEESLAAVNAPSTPLNAWVTPWNLTDTKNNLGNYAGLSAFWATVDADAIHLDPKADWATWDAFEATLPAANQKNIYLTVSGDPDVTYKDVSDPKIQAQHIHELLTVVHAHSFDGIDIDYEALGRENRDSFTQFIQNLATQFHQDGKSVAVTVEARINNDVPMDWAALSKSADQVRVMTYDYHSCSVGSPSPITPIGWLRDVLEYSKQTITPGKLVIGLGNYGCDWTEQADGSYKGTGISYDQAIATAKSANTPIITTDLINNDGYDTGAVRTYTYHDSDNQQHTVYFEDSTSLQDKIALVNQYNTAGIIFWNVGIGNLTLDSSVDQQ